MQRSPWAFYTRAEPAPVTATWVQCHVEPGGMPVDLVWPPQSMTTGARLSTMETNQKKGATAVREPAVKLGARPRAQGVLPVGYGSDLVR